MEDRRVTNFEWWHRAVFGPKPSKSAIPFQVMRDYEDYKREYAAVRHLAGDMAEKTVTVTGQWVEHLPQPLRRDMVKDIFSLASQKGWNIRVGGQRWDA